VNDIAASYFWVKTLHISCVSISISLFALRGTLELMGKPWRDKPVLRWAPHLVDTLLLTSALWLAWRIGQYPFVDGWLTAKVLALLAYILLGMRALSRKTPRSQRLPFFGAALLCASYIVGVALTHSPTWGLV
jgi:uncharacterized membrane protein SirB2